MAVQSGPGTIVDVRNYFEYSDAKIFRAEWSKLTEQDKTDLKNGVGVKGAGPMTY